MTKHAPKEPRDRVRGVIAFGPRSALLRFAGIGLAVLASLEVAAAEDRRGSDSSTGMAVTVERAHRECFADTVRVAGTLVPREESVARPDTDGLRITQVLVDDGDVVTEGQVLARLARPEGQPGQGPSTATVQAPAAGTVIGSTAEVGAIASMSAPPLFRIVVGREIELQADVALVRVAKLQAGQSARVEVAGVGDVIGRVRFIARQADPAAQSTKVRIFLGKDERLRVGTFADAIVDVDRICAPTISLSAVLYGPQGPIVQVVRNNRIETRPVPVGLISADKVQIREGLNEGDLVVARAGSFLREGDEVRPVLPADAKN
jgi:multidrug efflux pump subunit AcrA (membrane-fusion protein)